jgi:hypothetical protein
MHLRPFSEGICTLPSTVCFLMNMLVVLHDSDITVSHDRVALMTDRIIIPYIKANQFTHLILIGALLMSYLSFRFFNQHVTRVFFLLPLRCVSQLIVSSFHFFLDVGLPA